MTSSARTYNVVCHRFVCSSFSLLLLFLSSVLPTSSLAARSCVGSPYGRTLRLEAIAAAAVSLASDEAAGVHGTSLDVDGGRDTFAVFSGY